ncbi:MAG: signal peptidase II [Parcubacteria group bacterium Gr01-1014_18]|nr:MAG: signal peptidase II [Parcubacteria group bacterium Greene0416_36]TSC81026.1 MAG: signal peptidase II [Parcubacteria group bacterium Gr01-1014_18]TSC98948.1 MAG: signal peptidase II [Parcubacteria group bacterium Greene1014_20]TSD06760.1 MAG: hypothetical protein Greene07142_681 [Parcubacteria group bacterium Greene0714_2]
MCVENLCPELRTDLKLVFCVFIELFCIKML